MLEALECLNASILECSQPRQAFILQNLGQAADSQMCQRNAFGSRELVGAVPLVVGQAQRDVVEFPRALDAGFGGLLFFFVLFLFEKPCQAFGLHQLSPNCLLIQRHSAMISWAALPLGSNSVTASPVMIARENALRSPIVTGATG